MLILLFLFLFFFSCGDPPLLQHHPSCAVYQQTPGGKALVHRAKMPAVYIKAKGEAASIFAAALPRSVVVEGTFQVYHRVFLSFYFIL